MDDPDKIVKSFLRQLFDMCISESKGKYAESRRVRDERRTIAHF